MKKRHILKNYSRRSVIQTLGLTAAAPFIPILGAEAAGGSSPKRLLIITTPNGLSNGANPVGPVGADYEHGDAFKAALNRHKSDINIYRGLDYKARATGDLNVPNSHPALGPHLLTAALTTTGVSLTASNTATAVFHSEGKSIDQFISQKFMANPDTQTALGYIYAGVKTGIRGPFRHQVYDRPGNSVTPQINASALHSTIFDGTASSPGAGDQMLSRRLAERRSIIDYATAEINAVKRVLSAADKEKMEAHLEGVREIERQLDFEQSNTGTVACAPPTLKTETGSSEARYRLDGENMMDMIVQAFACDRTRVATLMWANSANGMKYTSKGLTKGHHTYTHEDFFEPETVSARDKISEWYAERFDYLLRKMKAVDEGGKSLLDNTLIIWTSEHSNDKQHSRSNIPFITAGSAGGAIKTGQYYNFNPRNRNNGGLGHGDMYVTAAHAMGFTDVNKFGIPQVSAGVLPGVLA